jgi:hypothetical protein
MLSAGDLLSSPAQPSLKRDRDSDPRSIPSSAPASGSENSSAQPRSIAGSRRRSAQENVTQVHFLPHREPQHTLPVHSAELGRLPVRQFEIANPFVPSGALGYPDNAAVQGMDGWSAPFTEFDGAPPLLPSDFFTSVLDNTALGTPLL